MSRCCGWLISAAGQHKVALDERQAGDGEIPNRRRPEREHERGPRAFVAA
jgi:hypothetical protein